MNYLTIGCLTGDVARSTTAVLTSRLIGDVARVVVEGLIDCSMDEFAFFCCNSFSSICC